MLIARAVEQPGTKNAVVTSAGLVESTQNAFSWTQRVQIRSLAILVKNLVQRPTKDHKLAMMTLEILLENLASQAGKSVQISVPAHKLHEEKNTARKLCICLHILSALALRSGQTWLLAWPGSPGSFYC